MQKVRFQNLERFQLISLIFLVLCTKKFRFWILSSYKLFLNIEFPFLVLILIVLLPELIFLDISLIQTFPKIQFTLLTKPSSRIYKNRFKLPWIGATKFLFVCVVVDKFLVLLKIFYLNLYLQIVKHRGRAFLPLSLIPHPGIQIKLGRLLLLINYTFRKKTMKMFAWLNSCNIFFSKKLHENVKFILPS